MNYTAGVFFEAFKIITSFNKEFITIIAVSVKVSGISTIIAVAAGIPFGIVIGASKFPGRNFIILWVNTLMALPTVLIGLLVYSLLSRNGPLGASGLLFTQTAMVIGQIILAFPIVAALSLGIVESHGKKAYEHALLLGATRIRAILTYLTESKIIFLAAALAAFGRVFSEVGISMMVGGNIRFYTRNITTAIALETSKGNFALGIALGMVLLTVAGFLNFLVLYFRKTIK